jgi:hypothetical protein
MRDNGLMGRTWGGLSLRGLSAKKRDTDAKGKHQKLFVHFHHLTLLGWLVKYLMCNAENW